jgi:hypothetical protein
MSKGRDVLGMIAGIVMILSSGAHSLLGWPALRSQLAPAGVSTDLQAGLAAGWHFGGAAMLVFGVIVLGIFGRRSGPPPSRMPAVLISALYIVFGAGALAANRDVFFLIVFVIPGVLLAFAATNS